jgi:hypothetical protein
MSARQFLMMFLLAASVPCLAIADDAASRQLVEKAIEKIGGDKLSKNKGASSKVKGNVNVNGVPLPITGEITSQGADQQRISVSLEVDGQQITFISVVNGDQGWQKLQDNTVDMTADQLARAKASAYATWVATLVPLKDKAFQLAPFGDIEINGRKATGVNVTRDGRRSVTLFFDKETSRLVRTETVIKDEQTFKDVTEQVNFSDFKDFDGIPHATKIAIKRDGNSHAELEVENFKPSEKLDDASFAKP